MTIFDQDELILTPTKRSQLCYKTNDFNYSIDELLQSDRFKKISSNSNGKKISSYFNELVHVKPSATMFFQAGFYLEQFIMNSLCSNVSNSNLDEFDFSDKAHFKILVPNSDSNYSLFFEIRNREELRYLDFLCEINENLSSRLTKVKNHLNLNDYFRLYYVMFDSGGKSVFNTDKTYTVMTHTSQRVYNLVDERSRTSWLWNSFTNIADLNYPNISIGRLHKDRVIDYESNHLMHFKGNLEFLKDPIYSSLICFDINYLRYFNI